ncbi:RusA family crossover junction endodeoxyribonuclease [Caulobacter sp. CCH5-E12]|uniref:RusA family crossover junction endodeoxyribonuclease n=1 Tax=Caulobacter sp. CCH5-E12 TaxID=1768770 RepID=UPI0007856AA2|nr:RusA family crossover junction endodeoxyribonuclease [Caulobacter sp. CCH5-E12]
MTVSATPHEFHVPGSPVSVNRYGTRAYRDWRGEVHARSIAASVWSGPLMPGPCSVKVRYFWRLDRRKDVDNILKAILDGLDGKIGVTPKPSQTVLLDDREVEHVVSQRTRLGFATRLDARRLRPEEYQAALAALSGQAAVFVSIGPGPNHARSVTR